MNLWNCIQPSTISSENGWPLYNPPSTVVKRAQKSLPTCRCDLCKPFILVVSLQGRM